MTMLRSRYYRTGPMTQVKRDWIQKQIEGLEQGNRDLVMRIRSDTINVAVNDKQIAFLKEVMERKT